MIRSVRGQVVHAAGILLVAVPVIFGALRLASTGSDLRYLWVALVTGLGAAAVTALGRARGISVTGIFLLFVAATFVATLLGRVTASFVGSRSAGASWFVAAGFALCQAAGFALMLLSRLRAMGAEWRAPDSPRP